MTYYLISLLENAPFVLKVVKYDDAHITPYIVILMDIEFIKKHPASKTYIIKKHSFFDKDVVLQGNAIIGAGSDFWGDLTVKGDLELGKGSTIKGNVTAEDAIIGSNCTINGNVTVAGHLTLLDRANIGGLVKAGGKMTIRPQVSARATECAGDIEIMGKTDIKSIRSGRKVIARMS
jgi:cytoskeletal protein CcmA (bactofilin family)